MPYLSHPLTALLFVRAVDLAGIEMALHRFVKCCSKTQLIAQGARLVFRPCTFNTGFAKVLPAAAYLVRLSWYV